MPYVSISSLIYVLKNCYNVNKINFILGLKQVKSIDDKLGILLFGNLFILI